MGKVDSSLEKVDLFLKNFIFFLGSPPKMTLHWRLKAFSGVPISREFPIPGFFQESGIIEYSHFPVPDLLPRDTTLGHSHQHNA